MAEFREIAGKIKQDIAFEWNANTDKVYMPEDKREAYKTLGGVHHLDKEYTVFGEVVEGLDVKVEKIYCEKQVCYFFFFSLTFLTIRFNRG